MLREAAIWLERLSDDYLSTQQEAQNVSRWLNETRFDVKCLTAVFAQLKSLESITFAYDSMEARYSKFAYRYCHRSQHEMSRPFISTLSALATSKLAVKHIRMHAEKKHGVISIGRLESLAPLLRNLDAAFENLQTLQLNLRDWRSLDSGFEIQMTRAPFVVRFLAKCSNVRKLELSCYSELENDLLGSLARVCRLTRLQRCKLDFMRIFHTEDLIDFLALSSSSLEELHLQHMLLADPQTSWMDIFNSLTDAPLPLISLRLLKVSRLCSQGILDTVRNVLFHDQGYQSDSLQIEGDDWRAQLKARECKYTMLGVARSWETGSTCYPFVGLEEHA